MPYTIGASHGPFTGQGSFVVAKPVGIRTVLSSVPSWTGHDGGDPRRYFKLGRFTMGNVDGFQFSHGIEYGNQLLYPMPPVWELLAYDIKNGASCLFQELVDVPDLSLKAPWDRTPQYVGNAAAATVNGGASQATMISYTVPTGRRLWLSKMTVRVRRLTVATTANGAFGLGYLDGFLRLYGTLFGGVIGSETSDGLEGSHLLLGPGQTIRIDSGSADAGGSVVVYAEWDGFLFDA